MEEIKLNSVVTAMKEICANCGCTYGSHCATSYYSFFYKRYIPRGYCPGTEGRMDWDRGPGTVFKHTGLFKDQGEKE